MICAALIELRRLLLVRIFFEETGLAFTAELPRVVFDLMIVDCLSIPSSRKSFERSRYYYSERNRGHLLLTEKLKLTYISSVGFIMEDLK